MPSFKHSQTPPSSVSSSVSMQWPFTLEATWDGTKSTNTAYQKVNISRTVVVKSSASCSVLFSVPCNSEELLQWLAQLPKEESLPSLHMKSLIINQRLISIQMVSSLIQLNILDRLNSATLISNIHLDQTFKCLKISVQFLNLEKPLLWLAHPDQENQLLFN